jgi:hypothetical protein
VLRRRRLGRGRLFGSRRLRPAPPEERQERYGRDEQHCCEGEQQIADSDREQRCRGQHLANEGHWAIRMIRRREAGENEGGPPLGGVGAAGTP